MTNQAALLVGCSRTKQQSITSSLIAPGRITSHVQLWFCSSKTTFCQLTSNALTRHINYDNAVKASTTRCCCCHFSRFTTILVSVEVVKLKGCDQRKCSFTIASNEPCATRNAWLASSWPHKLPQTSEPWNKLASSSTAQSNWRGNLKANDPYRQDLMPAKKELGVVLDVCHFRAVNNWSAVWELPPSELQARQWALLQSLLLSRSYAMLGQVFLPTSGCVRFSSVCFSGSRHLREMIWSWAFARTFPAWWGYLLPTRKNYGGKFDVFQTGLE